MNRQIYKIGIMACLAFGVGPSLVFGQPNGKCSPPAETAFRSMSRTEMEVMIADIGETNPAVIELLRNEPDFRKAQVENIRDLLSLASQAVKEGIASESFSCIELINIRDEVIAANYFAEAKGTNERSLVRDGVTESQIAAFWGDNKIQGANQTRIKEREEQFDRFIAGKLALLERESANGGVHSVSQDERKQARDFFARTQIAVSNFEGRKQQVPDTLRALINTQIKLQQAQFLARQYSKIIASKISATEAEINAFVAARPELNTDAAKVKATQILERAKKGDDFGSLADQYSEDPGNKNAAGKLNGGLYRGVQRGQFFAVFEQAALSLRPGEVFPSLVETELGFHVIKLEKKVGPPNETFDVRHILIDTTVADDENPGGRGLSVPEYAKRRVESEKERKLLAGLAEAHRISVASDFRIPGPPVK